MQLYFKEWVSEGDHFHELGASMKPDGFYDSMAEVQSIGHNRWRIAWWAAPQTPDSMQETEFEGTLEEAKAYAVAMVKF